MFPLSVPNLHTLLGGMNSSTVTVQTDAGKQVAFLIYCQLIFSVGTCLQTLVKLQIKML